MPYPERLTNSYPYVIIDVVEEMSEKEEPPVDIEMKVIRRKSADPGASGRFRSSYPDSLFDGNQAQINYRWREKLLVTDLVRTLSD
jgi:hypothetical protein